MKEVKESRGRCQVIAQGSTIGIKKSPKSSRLGDQLAYAIAKPEPGDKKSQDRNAEIINVASVSDLTKESSGGETPGDRSRARSNNVNDGEDHGYLDVKHGGRNSPVETRKARRKAPN